ncbi:hypothetical protein IW262DRAFT_1301740 [Armillaria fumosa]|nr:hypothetical protein IW262DRAFT_1301740 [Armillaria fumosa]
MSAEGSRLPNPQQSQLLKGPDSQSTTKLRKTMTAKPQNERKGSNKMLSSDEKEMSEEVAMALDEMLMASDNEVSNRGSFMDETKDLVTAEKRKSKTDTEDAAYIPGQNSFAKLAVDAEPSTKRTRNEREEKQVIEEWQEKGKGPQASPTRYDVEHYDKLLDEKIIPDEDTFDDDQDRVEIITQVQSLAIKASKSLPPSHAVQINTGPIDSFTRCLRMDPNNTFRKDTIHPMDQETGMPTPSSLFAPSTANSTRQHPTQPNSTALSFASMFAPAESGMKMQKLPRGKNQIFIHLKPADKYGPHTIALHHVFMNYCPDQINTLYNELQMDDILVIIWAWNTTT